eukprot:CAMPEP_0197234540 /NCGR_PEP_ID=MMETSP1429-20130617/2265_1 /TAXON_ID=49237 /ORGANISM="Chaetoceros  sp., Strain UNC1202" /LENGTH=400 /DNA_ID=CAMNT_0042692979 /DNA_START=35 /DNA_END=1237 /DNA_ORIENTATION=+
MKSEIPEPDTEGFSPPRSTVVRRVSMTMKKRASLNSSIHVVAALMPENDEGSATQNERKLNRLSVWIYNNRRQIFLYGGLALVLMTLFTFTYDNQVNVQNASSVKIKGDFSKVTSLDALEAFRKNMSDLCFPGRKEKCSCPDPMKVEGRQGRHHWLRTSYENADAVSNIKEGLDVVFYGDSITEGWMGTSYGSADTMMDKNLDAFKDNFSLEDGGKYKGLALGISGDRTTDLLWRLQNGEMPQSLHPKVFWLLIGTNDLGNSWCSPEATLLGILRVVEEIRSQKPGATIVVNSIFPRSYHKKGYVSLTKRLRDNAKLLRKDNPPPLWNAIKDINEKLKEYCAQHDNVEYFDTNDMFFMDPLASEKELRIDEELMPDFLHPSSGGYKLWGDKIVDKLDELI